MRRDKKIAFKLRRGGKSYGEIQKALGIPKSTLSEWFSSLQLPAGVQKRILSRAKRRSIRTLLRYSKHQTTLASKRKNLIQNKAEHEIKPISDYELLLIGTALYWAEGYKRSRIKQGRELTSHAVSLTNSDPNLVRIFLAFLRRVCAVRDDKIRANLRIYKHQNASSLMDFWSKVTEIQKAGFGKIYLGVSKSSKGQRPFNRLPYGTIQIRIYDTQLFHRIMGWIAGIKRAI